MKLIKHNIHFTMQDATGAELAAELRSRLVAYLETLGFANELVSGDYTFLRHPRYADPRLQLWVTGAGTATTTTRSIYVNFMDADVGTTSSTLGNPKARTVSTSTSHPLAYKLTIDSTFTVDYTLTVLQSDGFLAIFGHDGTVLVPQGIGYNGVAYCTMKHLGTSESKLVFLGYNCYKISQDAIASSTTYSGSNQINQYVTTGAAPQVVGRMPYLTGTAPVLSDTEYAVLAPFRVAATATRTGSSSYVYHAQYTDYYLDEVYAAMTQVDTTEISKYQLLRKYRFNDELYLEIAYHVFVKITEVINN